MMDRMTMDRTKITIVIFISCIFWAIVASTATSTTAGNCTATWDPESRILHIPSLKIGDAPLAEIFLISATEN